MKKIYARALAFLSVDHPSPGLKQLPLVVAFAISLIVLVPLLIAGIALMVVATIFAALCTRYPRLVRWIVVVPLLDFLAIGAYRCGTGAILSLFGAMVVLPVVWIAAERGRHNILIASAGTLAALIMPYAFSVVVFASASDVVRFTFSPLVYLFVAAIINELARQSRSQLHDIHGLVDEKERMLQRTFEYASQLEDSEVKFRAADRLFRGVWAAVTEQSVM
jgi:hypothetical protein